MGARVYLTSLGRFAQVDPVEGGTDNAYAYANDPVNEYDLDGTFIPFVVGALYVGGVAWSAYEAKKNPNPTNMGFLALAVVPGGGGARIGGKVARTALKKVGGKIAKPFISSGKKALLSLGTKIYNSKYLGRQSSLFGSKQLGGPAGKWNSNDRFRIGWSTHRGKKTFRISRNANGSPNHRERILFHGNFK